MLAAADETLALMGPLAELHRSCGWECWSVSFELDMDALETGENYERRTLARSEWEGKVAAMPGGVLRGKGAGSFSFSRRTVPLPGASPTPAACGEVYSHPGELEVVLVGRRIGEGLRIGFVPVTRIGMLEETCAGRAAAYAVDVALAFLAPLGQRPAAVPARPGGSFDYSTDIPGLRARVAIGRAGQG